MLLERHCTCLLKALNCFQELLIQMIVPACKQSDGLCLGNYYSNYLDVRMQGYARGQPQS